MNQSGHGLTSVLQQSTAAASRPPVPARIRTNTVANDHSPPFFTAVGNETTKELPMPEQRFGGQVAPRHTAGRSPLRKAASETNLKKDQRDKKYGHFLHANTGGVPLPRPRGPAPPPPVHRRAPGVVPRSPAIDQSPHGQKSPIQRPRSDDIARNVVTSFEMFPWFQSEWGRLPEDQRRATLHHINQLLQV